MLQLKLTLAWCLALNYAVLVAWSATFVFAHGWMYRVHGRWFQLSVERFDALNWLGLAVYKIGILLFNLVPLVALVLARAR